VSNAVGSKALLEERMRNKLKYRSQADDLCYKRMSVAEHGILSTRCPNVFPSHVLWYHGLAPWQAGQSRAKEMKPGTPPFKKYCLGKEEAINDSIA